MGSYKIENREVLTAAVLSLLNDLGADHRGKILEGDPQKKLWTTAKRIYDSEFDLNVETLDIAGAK